MPKQAVVVSIDQGRRAQAVSVGEAILGYLDELYRFALRMTRDGERARELTQESVLRALERQNTITRNVRAWLFQTLYHAFISHYRYSLHRATLTIENSSDHEVDLGPVPNPLPVMIATGDVRSALESLPEELRVVVWLADAEEFRLREIAEILEWPLGTVASRLARARRELRRLLSAYGPTGEKHA